MSRIKRNSRAFAGRSAPGGIVRLSRRPAGGTHRSKYHGGMVIKHTAGEKVADIVIYGVLILTMLCCIIPLWHVFMSAFSDGPRLFAGEGTVGGIAWFPVSEAHLGAFAYLFENLKQLLQGFGNTLIYVVGATVFGMIVCVSAAYPLSRKSKLRPLMMIFVTFTIMFNGGLIPTYKVIQSLGWVNTRWALLIPGCTNAFFCIMLSNAFAAVPDATIESAEIDGAGHFRIMSQIVFPQAKSFVTVIVLNSVVLQWNSWINASIYLDSRAINFYPLQLWLRDWCNQAENFLVNAGGSLLGPNYNEYLLQFAAIAISVIPVLAIFPFFQKRLEKGQLQGAVKG